jgi:CheY-like chemotaxis protein
VSRRRPAPTLYLEPEDGRLSVESTPGQGSRFTFTARFGHGWPAADDWPPPAEPAALQSACPGQILLVEDHPVNQEVAIRLLEAWGHAVTTAESGPAALAALADRHVDLVLMDVQMPGMDGLHATAEIRRREQGRGARTPIVALTARHGGRPRTLPGCRDGRIARTACTTWSRSSTRSATRSTMIPSPTQCTRPTS